VESVGVVGKSKSLGDKVIGDEEFEKDGTDEVVSVAVVEGACRCDSKGATVDFSPNE